ncbi:unnamed protein product [Polarella glacialis]|uniref:Uncharacterized protein n=1 Tax=Polarella glacialis TaxID=89957 RepID=A0A813KQF9_POLGL|nr:unnamed protein product [Polarella glacialis]
MPLSCRCVPMSTVVPMSCAEHGGAAEKRSPSCSRLEEFQAVRSGSCSYSDAPSYSDVLQLQCLPRAGQCKGLPTLPYAPRTKCNCAYLGLGLVPPIQISDGCESNLCKLVNAQLLRTLVSRSSTDR